MLDALVAEGLLSDGRYARSVLIRRGGNYSRRRIVEELRAAGVARDKIEAAVEDADLDDEAALLALWQRRFGRAPGDEKERARQVRFLQARGFALSAILKLLRRQGMGK